MSYLLYILFGFFPSIVWLLFYLKADTHPEPKKEILAVFLFGALATIPAIIIELALSYILNTFSWPEWIALLIGNVIGVALIEEMAKYGAVWIKEQEMNQNSELDEPVDLVIYMIAAALGFAAIENLLFLLPIVQMNLAIITSLFRALSAILLHTLCSGTIGYYLALSFCDTKKKTFLFLKGLFIASFLHGSYNLFIIKSESNKAYLFVPLLILAGLAVFLYKDFKKLKKMGSVCKIKEILA